MGLLAAVPVGAVWDAHRRGPELRLREKQQSANLWVRQFGERTAGAQVFCCGTQCVVYPRAEPPYNLECSPGTPSPDRCELVAR